MRNRIVMKLTLYGVVPRDRNGLDAIRRERTLRKEMSSCRRVKAAVSNKHLQ